jgi:hypothetical protein
MFARQIDFSDRCADRYTIGKIDFGQRCAYAHFRGFRSVVQDTAALLLVLAKWDYSRFCEFQEALADAVSDKCRPIDPITKKPIRYTGRQVRGALKTLEAEGYLIIPRSVSRDERLAKTYRFHRKFYEILDKSPVNVCDKHLLRPAPAVSEIPRSHIVSSNSQNPVVIKNESRADDRTSRDAVVKTIRAEDAHPKKTVYSRAALPRDLSPVHRQIVHWLAGCAMLSGQAEAITLCGAFMSRRDDEQIGYWVQTWPEMTKAEKSFAVRQLIGVLRALPSAAAVTHNNTDAADCPPAVRESVGDNPPPDYDRFRTALIFGGAYDGPRADFLAKFRSADDTMKELMLLDFQTKMKNGKFFVD